MSRHEAERRREEGRIATRLARAKLEFIKRLILGELTMDGLSRSEVADG